MALTRFGQATLLRVVITVLFLRGLITLLFGIGALLWPVLTIEDLTTFFAVFVLLDGVVSLLLALTDLSQRVLWRGHLGEGLLGLIIGLATCLRANITVLGLLSLVMTWALALGILEMFLAFWTRNISRESWLAFINGLFAFLFGLVLLVQPAAGAVASVCVIVLYALILQRWAHVLSYFIHYR